MSRTPIERPKRAPKAAGRPSDHSDIVALDHPWQHLGHVFDAVASTMTEARQRALDGAPHGTWVLARTQTAGRGRLGRTWQSEPDAGVYMTLLLRPEPGQSVQGLPLVFGMAAFEAVCDVLRAQGVAAPESVLGLKWPNDVMAHGRKLGGILMEADELGGPNPVVRVGMGLNVQTAGHLSLAPDVAARYIGVLDLMKTWPCGPDMGVHRARPWVDALAQALVYRAYGAYTRFCDAGLETALIDWRTHDVLRGRTVSARVGEQAIEGTAQGIGPDGRLRLQSSHKTVWVDSGEVLVVPEVAQGLESTNLTRSEAAVYVGLTPEAP